MRLARKGQHLFSPTSTKLFKGKSGQAIIEYTSMILIVVAAVVLIRPYVIRGINAHMKTWEDAVDDSLNDPLKQSNLIITDFCGNGTCDSGESLQSCCQDCGSCGDDFCCAATHENLLVSIGGVTRTQCPQDCGSCGDNYCCNDSSTSKCHESIAGCCHDCPVPVGCPGDGQCCLTTGYIGTPPFDPLLIDPSECAADCTANLCGNGICNAGEDKLNCCADCASCGDNKCDLAGTCGTYRESKDPNDPDYCNCDCHCPNGQCDNSSTPPACIGTRCMNATCEGWIPETDNSGFNFCIDCGCSHDLRCGICRYDYEYSPDGGATHPNRYCSGLDSTDCTYNSGGRCYWFTARFGNTTGGACLDHGEGACALLDNTAGACDCDVNCVLWPTEYCDCAAGNETECAARGYGSLCWWAEDFYDDPTNPPHCIEIPGHSACMRFRFSIPSATDCDCATNSQCYIWNACTYPPNNFYCTH